MVQGGAPVRVTSDRLGYGAVVAVVFLFRVAIALTPAVYRFCSTSGCDANTAANAAARFWDRISSPSEDAAALSAEITSTLPEGALFAVTDFTGDLDARKFTVRWSRAPTGSTEDQDQITMHMLGVTSGAPRAWVAGTDDAAVEAAFGTFWGSVKPSFPTTTHLDIYRWNMSGPSWDVTPSPYNPSVRVTEVDVAGTSGASMLPPQTAISVTLKTSIRKRWGRVYLPAPTTSLGDAVGRVAATGTYNLHTVADAFKTFVNACVTANVQPVVVSRAHPAYTTAKGHAIAAQVWTAYPVTAIQVDDLFDVIRRRRYSAALVKDSQTVNLA